MWLNGWNRWIVLVGALVATLTGSQAQMYSRPLSDLDRLPTWYPTYETTLPGRLPVSSARPYMYMNLDDLLQKLKAGSKIEALTVDANVLKAGRLERLRSLTGVRALYVNIFESTSQSIDSLVQIAQEWPSLERFVVNVNLASITKAEPNRQVVLPMSMDRFPKVHEVQLGGSGMQWDASLKALVGLKTLRQLTLNNWSPANEQAIQFVAIPQLTGLKINGSGFAIRPGMFAPLKQLKTLTMSSIMIDTTTFGQTLTELPDLETLSIENTRLPKSLTLSGLKNLKTLELTNDYNLLVESTTFAGLANLERLVIYSTLGKDLSGLCSLPHLRTLILGGQGKPVQLADCLGQLNQLTELRLERMTMGRLPAGIGSLRQLKKLSLSGCGLDSLPPSIGQLTSLEELTLDGNKIRQLPDLGQLRQLEQLSVSNNQLTALSSNIGQLTKLTTLNLINNKLTQLPATLTRLTALRMLTLNTNQLEQLPDDLGKLRKLQSLGLQGNPLVSLPASIDQLDSLKSLFIGNNRLQRLPATLSKLKNLTQLFIGKNELTALPADIGALTALTTLSIELNPLIELPASISQLRNLKALTIMGTQVRLLPDNIGALTKLEGVTLSNNELIALPNSIGGWQNVTNLSLDQNRLEGLPNGIGRLSKLTSLRISGKDKVVESSVGGLQQLPDSIIHCTQLRDLTIQRQPQLDATDVLTKAARLKSLTNLQIVESNLSRLPDIDWKTVNWQTLSLNGNLLTELPTAILDAPFLRTIAVNQNKLPEALDQDFYDKETLLVSFVEADVLPTERLPKPSRKAAMAYQQLSRQKAQQRDWDGALADLDKAVEYAPDTTRAFAYGQRASFHFFRKEYPAALADFDKAIEYVPLLKKDKQTDSLTVKRALTSFWQQKAAIYGVTGQYDAALTALTQAESQLPGTDNTPLSGLVHIERGRYLALKDKWVEADSSYRKAIRAYEKLTYADPGTRLTVVELSLLTGQYSRAQRAIDNLPTEQLRGNGFDLLKEYLEICLSVLKGERDGPKATERLTAYLGSHPTKIYGWSFDLFDNWLNKSKLPPDKVTALRQLTDATKERLVKPQ